MSRAASLTEQPAPGWCLKLGIGIFLQSMILPVAGIPVVSGLALSGTMTASVSGALLVSAEVLGVLAVAVMGKPGFLLKILVVVDEYTRFLIAADVSSSIDSTRVFRTLEYAILMYGKPECLRSDNGPEFMSRATTLWTIEKGIDQSLINPGKPIENSIVECFNGRFRDEFLNENLFLNTEEARKKLAERRVHYNTKRPYSSLRNKTPEEFWLEFEDGLTELVG